MTTWIHGINLMKQNYQRKKTFYSQLYEENITDKDYARANIVWKHFSIKNLGEYHDLYLMTDVYLLTDVFENFRDMCLNYYGLDPAYYITLPNYSWNAFLSLTGVRLQQIHIKEMYEMIENGLRFLLLCSWLSHITSYYVLVATHLTFSHNLLTTFLSLCFWLSHITSYYVLVAMLLISSHNFLLRSCCYALGCLT